jgi:hypothetical protein
LPPLPSHKTPVAVFADFLQYLYQCARIYINECHFNGVELWNSLMNSTQFILSHPNGWEGPQQNMMRRAAVLAGLIPDTPEGQARIQLVTEGEASLHFCIGNNFASESIMVRLKHVAGLDMCVESALSRVGKVSSLLMRVGVSVACIFPRVIN